MAGSIEAVQKILQETIAPGIGDIRERLARIEGEMTGLKAEIRRLDDKIDNGLARLDQKVDSLRGEMASGFARQSERTDHLEDNFRTAIDIRERLAALEGRASR